MIVTCPNCSVKNRIPDSPEPGTTYSCATCKTELASAPKAAEPQRESSFPVRPGADKASGTRRAKGTARRLAPNVHPLLIALFPALALYSANTAEVSPSEVWMPLAAGLGLALLLVALSLLLIALIGLAIRRQARSRAWRRRPIWDLRKAAIITSLLLVLFLSYGHVLAALGEWDSEHRAVAPTGRWMQLSWWWLIIFAFGAVALLWMRRDLRKPTTILNVAALVLVIIPTASIVFNEMTASNPRVQPRENIESTTFNTGDLAALPDIYYIVLDRYGSPSTLKKVYDFDNSGFIDHLTEVGFYVASESVSNYPSTELSLRSSLNMDFIHEEAAVGSSGGSIRDHEVWRFLKSQGYTFVHFGSWYESTRENPFADVNINYHALPDFSMSLFQTTWVYPWCTFWDWMDEWWETQYKRVKCKFNRLSEIPEMEEPTFVFAHMMIPHDPFVFDRNGDLVAPEDFFEKDTETRYLDQLVALNRMLEALVESLLSTSDVPPVIILQADEGPYPERLRTDPENFVLAEASEAELRQKMRILNAYCLPNIDRGVLYPSITPVNSFRVVFNACFGADLELLPDRCYVRCSDDTSEFLEVTDIVKHD